MFSYEAIKLGFFIGILFTYFLITIVLLMELKFFSMSNNPFIEYHFPIFRGTLALFIYLFFLGCNVYFWEKYFINYRGVFSIQLHYSTSYEIFKRSFIFLTLWIIIFLYSAIGYLYDGNILVIFNKSVEKYIPPLIWGFFIVYIFSPFKNFNWRGRIYFFKLIKRILISPCFELDFTIPWATD